MKEIGLLCALATTVFAAEVPALIPTKPNIVLIMVDDLDVGSIDTMIASGMMPNLKQIVDSGSAFTQSFVTNSLGCPSRQTLFSGQYYHNLAPRRPGVACNVALFNDQTSLPTWLHAAGYRTGLIGRYMDGLGYNDVNGDGKVDIRDVTYIPPGWDSWEPFVVPDPFPVSPPESGVPSSRYIVPWDPANMYDYVINHHGRVVKYGSAESDYQTDVLANRAVQFILESERFDTSPFFLMIAPTAPHVEVFPIWTTFDELADAWYWDIRPAPRHSQLTLPLPRPPAFDEENVTDKPVWVQRHRRLTSEDISALERQYRNRLTSLLAVDELIGKVLSTLSATGEAANTVILFTADNGWFLGEHRLSNKLSAHEEAIRVPLYVNVGGGKAVPAVVTNVDLAATIADLADATPTRSLDGVSFVPLLTDAQLPWRKRFLIEHNSIHSGAFEVPTYVAVRTGQDAGGVPNQLYVEYLGGSYLGGSDEFYDLTTDAAQLTSLHLDQSPLRSWQRSVLQQWLTRLKGCANGSCQTLEFGVD